MGKNKDEKIDVRKYDEDYLESQNIDVEFAKSFFIGRAKAGNYNFGHDKTHVFLQPVLKGNKALKLVETKLTKEKFFDIFNGKTKGDDRDAIKAEIEGAIE